MYHTLPNGIDPLLHAAMHLLSRQAGAPTVRDVATEAGVSPSLIAYRYGSMEALLAEALIEARRQEATIWARRTDAYLGHPVREDDLAGLLNELLLCETRPDSSLAALRWLRTVKAVRQDASACNLLTEEEVVFWERLGRQLGLGCNAAQIIAALFHGLALGHVLGAAEPGFTAWSSTLVSRFTERLLRGSIPSGRPDSRWRAVFAGTEGARIGTDKALHPTRQALLEAAAAILIKEGASSLTHRRLATEAAASVSSVVHFFENRRSILREAYEYLYLRARSRAVEGLSSSAASERRFTPTEFVDALWPDDMSLARASELEVIGMLNVMFEASRAGETRDIALSLFARSGETSLQLLTQIVPRKGDIGWLDAQIFRLVSNGLLLVTRSGPGAARSPADHPGRMRVALIAAVASLYTSDLSVAWRSIP